MWATIGEVLGSAVGIAISPVPIAAVILMLFSTRARTNGPAFAVAWMVGVAAVVSIVSAVPGLEDDGGGPSPAAGWIKVVLGVLLLAGAATQWRGRPVPGEQPPVPGWMARVDSMAPPAAAGLGLVLSAVNPKNLLLGAAAGVVVGSSDLSGGEVIGVVVVFTAIASVTVVAPVVAYLVARDRMAPALDRTKEWLVANNSAVLAVLFVVFAAKLLGDGLRILAA